MSAWDDSTSDKRQSKATRRGSHRLSFPPAAVSQTRKSTLRRFQGWSITIDSDEHVSCRLQIQLPIQAITTLNTPHNRPAAFRLTRRAVAVSPLRVLVTTPGSPTLRCSAEGQRDFSSHYLSDTSIPLGVALRLSRLLPILLLPAPTDRFPNKGKRSSHRHDEPSPVD